jgi:hypothetical protein
VYILSYGANLCGRGAVYILSYGAKLCGRYLYMSCRAATSLVGYCRAGIMYYVPYWTNLYRRRAMYKLF